VRTGRGGNFQGNGNIIEIEPIFGGITPEEVTQDMVSGDNDLQAAKTLTIAYGYQIG